MENAKRNIIANAFARYIKSTGDNRDCVSTDDVIVFLESEIDYYRDKIKYLENRLYSKDIKTNESITTLKAVQENTAGEIIKALADNGYNTITINCYKNIESEG